MSIFAVEIVEEVRSGKLTFYKLTVNGKCLYDEFCADVEHNAIDRKHLNTIRSYMNFIAESNKSLPGKKFNSIKQSGNVIGYEFKSGLLRLYVIKEDPNVFIVLGGYKSDQKKDINKFAHIYKKYKDSLKNK